MEFSDLRLIAVSGDVRGLYAGTCYAEENLCSFKINDSFGDSH